MKTKIAQNLFTILVFSLSLETAAVAQHRLHSEFSLHLSPSDQGRLVETVLAPLDGSRAVLLDDFIIETPYRTEIKGVSIQAITHAEPISQIETGLFQLRGELSQIKLQIASVATNHVVEQVVGGVVVRVEIKGSCKNVVVQSGTYPLSILLNAGIGVTDGKFVGQIGQFDIGVVTGWYVSADSCEGLSDYRQILTNQIQSALASADFLRNQLKPLLLKSLQSSLDSLNSELKKTIPVNMGVSDIASQLRVLKVASEPTGELVMSGLWTFDLPKSKINGERTVTFKNSASATGASHLTVPEGLITEMLAFLYEGRVLQGQIRSRQIAGFQDLMSSRFTQFFVWPDLLNYSSKADFVFNIYPVRYFNLGAFTNEGGGVRAPLSGVIRTDMFAPRDGVYHNYIYFESSTQGQAVVKADGDTVVVGLENPNLSLSYRWDDNYVARYAPFTILQSGLIRSGLKSTLEQRVARFKLPNFGLQALKLRPETTQVKNANLELFFSVNP